MTDLNPKNTAVVVVDMQNDFAHEDGALFAPPSQEAIGPVSQVVQMADQAGATVVFTQDVHTPSQFDNTDNYDEFERWGEHVLEGTWGAQIVDDLNPEDNADRVVQKHTYDAFHNTELDGWLSARGIENVVLCGTLANVCVLHTASSAALNDYRAIIVEDALGYLEEDDLEYSTNHASWLFGELTTVDELDF